MVYKVLTSVSQPAEFEKAHTVKGLLKLYDFCAHNQEYISYTRNLAYLFANPFYKISGSICTSVILNTREFKLGTQFYV